MKRKELKNIAKKMAMLELSLKNANDSEKKAIEAEMMAITYRIINEDGWEADDTLGQLDEMIQEILKNS
jgi:hypothetical protein